MTEPLELNDAIRIAQERALEDGKRRYHARFEAAMASAFAGPCFNAQGLDQYVINRHSREWQLAMLNDNVAFHEMAPGMKDALRAAVKIATNFQDAPPTTQRSKWWRWFR
jgi:hypothetical protein